ncbi:hypothetical protein [Streptomyces syringium]|uniref:hypothetical protein n=1 Tax=Streptomyces syringium TaxID=76729 RepID=UPI003451D7F5
MSFRDDILAGLRASEDTAIGDLTPEGLLEAYRAEVLREVADELADQAPPVTAGPRTQYERGLMDAVYRLRGLASIAEGGVRDEH